MPAVPRTSVRRAAPLLLAAVLATSALSGCGGDNDEPAADPTPATSSAPTTTSTAPSPSVAPSSTPATPTPSAPTPLAARLLDAQDVPTLSGDVSDTPNGSWSNGKTHAAPMTAFGVCQRYDLLSIGAESAVERDFVAGKNAPTGATAAEQVAQMPDAMTAQRARKVLTSWHDTCRSRIKDVTSPDVGPVTTVAVPHGSAVWYDVAYTSTATPGTRHSHSFGIVVSGTRIALLRIDSDAPAHSSPAGSEPMATAVKAASARLG